MRKIIATTKSNVAYFLCHATKGQEPVLDQEPVHWTPESPEPPLFINARLIDGLVISMHAFMWIRPIELPPDLDRMQWKGGSVRQYLEVELTAHERMAVLLKARTNYSGTNKALPPAPPPD